MNRVVGGPHREPCYGPGDRRTFDRGAAGEVEAAAEAAGLRKAARE